MKLKFKNIFKKGVVLAICLASLATTVEAAIPKAEAARGSSEILGTNTALGSPILNETNFDTADWNKWETICWGVFLSNFCQPLIDTYETAFHEGTTGSKGEGFRALWGGSGSDKANAAIIKALCDYAIEAQKAYSDTIYVGYTHIKDGIPDTRPNIYESSVEGQTKATVTPKGMGSFSGKATKDELEIREATFKDLWLAGQCNTCNGACKKHSWAQYKHVGDIFGLTTYTSSTVFTEKDGNYDDIINIQEGSLPTFYIKRGDKYVVIWDYTDWWDIQVTASMTNAIRNSDYGDDFDTAFYTNWEASKDAKDDNDSGRIVLDPFGNIVMQESGTMVIPASANQHITTEPTLNILNSWMVNSYIENTKSEAMVLGLRQNLNTIYGNGEFFQSEITNGFPAFGESNVGHIGLFYYDLDTIYSDAIRNNETLPYGTALLRLFDLDLTDEASSTFYPLKYEVAGNGIGSIKLWKDKTNTDELDGIVASTYLAASILPNVNFVKGKTQKTVLSQIITPEGNTLNLFSKKAIAIPVKTSITSIKKENSEKNGTNEGFIRKFYNYIYQCYSGNVDKHDAYTSRNITSLLEGKAWTILSNEKAWMSDGGTLGDMMTNFTKYDTKYKGKEDLASDWHVFWDVGNNETANQNTNRVVVAFPPSDVMVSASSILGIKDGAEFSTYCSYIYMTYLDFYKVSSSSTLTETSYTSRFNADIYISKVDNVDRSILIEDIGKALDKHGGQFEYSVEMEKEVVQYSYLMLSPTEGREYRKSMIESGMADWMYEQYNKLVYGGSGEYAGSASKYRAGFLSIENYSDNFLTGWFIDYYVEIVVWAIMLGILAVLIVGLIKGKKISWFFITSLLIVNGVLLVPSACEIVPYFTSSITQRMFTNKMTFWSISQGVTNASIENDVYYAEAAYGMNKQDAEALVDLVKNLSVLQTDSSLSVKQDISQKVTQKLASGVWSDIESYQSARWILPMVMQQFTSDDMSADYIYKPLANIWDDLSNIYWYFCPENATHIDSQKHTLTSAQNGESVNVTDKTDGAFNIYNNITTYFPDVNTKKSNSKIHYFKNPDIDYRSSAYKNDSGQEIDENKLAHLVCYYLDSNIKNAFVIPASRGDLASNGNYTHLELDDKGGESTWKAYIRMAVNSVKNENWMTTTTGGFEDTADSYERDDRGTITSDMPYLLSTESPIYYFYAVVKDSFQSDINLGGLIFQLQGQATKDKTTDTILRSSFMYATKGEVANGSVQREQLTTYVKDILDLEEMFYNMIPYMYQMQLTAGGFDGESGILVEDDGYTPLKITDELNYYEGTLQSWMYRCNWATKIMENPNFEKSCYVKDADGKKYTVANPLLWECYPENRPMVFSEAQKEAMGLSDSDLNVVELKCIEVNKKVARQWTLLVNYAGTQGITTEVLMRQMATDATLIFCQEFSSSGLLDTTYEIYPQSLDLRYISFDSIMKMLVMNVSKDTSYIYGDTMLTVISNSDIFTSILLLLTAFICALLVPLARCVLLALIFYLGFIGIFRSILHDNKTKANVACGQLISNALFMVYTIAYFFCFYLMMNITSSDEVLTVSNIKAEAGNPVWVILIVIALSILYIVVMDKHIRFCWATRADMGYAAYAHIVGGAIDKVGGAVDKVREGASNFIDKFGDTSYNTTNTNSISGSGVVDTSTQMNSTDMSSSSSSTNSASSTRNKQSSINSTTISEEQLNSNSTIMNSETSSGYNVADNTETISSTQASDINAEIEAGKLVVDES